MITWESEPDVEKVKLEYSPDNGTTYLPIAVDVANIGHYEWVVPYHISSHCLVRVSELKDRKMPPHGLVYEMDFRVNGAEFSGKGDTFTFYLGDATDESIKNNLPGVSFSHEANGRVYIHLADICKEIGRFTGFNDRWHNVQVFMDNVYDRISVILDGHLVFENIPRSPMAYFSPAISFSVGPGKSYNIEIDNVFVSAFYSYEENIQDNSSSSPRPYALGSRPLFNEDFRQLTEKNSIENSGWRTKNERYLERDKEESEFKALSIKPGEDEQVTVVKTFNVPVDFPFDISDKTFEIRYNNDMFNDTVAYDAYPRHGGHGPSANNIYSSSSTTHSNSIPGISRTSELFNTYYIYTFDGKLLAEYDHNGSCIRDYIYAGNRLIAEYKPQTSEYFYYMNDQINSTRIITNSSGNVVFSEAYGPYGDVQKTWTNAYNPKLKFSGKEREGYSDLDYFGARYYDRKSYRFNSVDPIINKGDAVINPQLWNLYTYCRNNPITYFDPAGRKIQIKNKELINEFEQTLGIRLKFEDKNNPNLVTGFTVKHKQLKEMLKMLQEIIDSPILINIIDKTETDHDSLNLIIGGASFDEGNVYIDRYVYFPYNKKGGGKKTMPVGEKILHELIGHGYDYIKRENSTEKKAIRRINEHYRRPLGIEERVEK